MKLEDIVVGMTVVCPRKPEPSAKLCWPSAMDSFVGAPLTVLRPAGHDPTIFRCAKVDCVQDEFSFEPGWFEPYAYKVGDLVRVLPAPDRPGDALPFGAGDTLSTWGRKKHMVGRDWPVEKVEGAAAYLREDPSSIWGFPPSWLQLVKPAAKVEDWGVGIEARLAKLEATRDVGSRPRAAEWGSFKRDIQDRLKKLEAGHAIDPKTGDLISVSHLRDVYAANGTAWAPWRATVDERLAFFERWAAERNGVLGLPEKVKSLESTLDQHSDALDILGKVVSKLESFCGPEYEKRKVDYAAWQSQIDARLARIEGDIAARLADVKKQGLVSRVETLEKWHASFPEEQIKARLAKLENPEPKPGRLSRAFSALRRAPRAGILALAGRLVRVGGGRLEIKSGSDYTFGNGGAIVIQTGVGGAGLHVEPKSRPFDRWSLLLALLAAAGGAGLAGAWHARPRAGRPEVAPVVSERRGVY